MTQDLIEKILDKKGRDVTPNENKVSLYQLNTEKTPAWEFRFPGDQTVEHLQTRQKRKE